MTRSKKCSSFITLCGWGSIVWGVFSSFFFCVSFFSLFLFGFFFYCVFDGGGGMRKRYRTSWKCHRSDGNQQSANIWPQLASVPQKRKKKAKKNDLKKIRISNQINVNNRTRTGLGERMRFDRNWMGCFACLFFLEKKTKLYRVLPSFSVWNGAILFRLMKVKHTVKQLQSMETR